MRKAWAHYRAAIWMTAPAAVAATGVVPSARQGLAAETERIAEALNWTVVFLMAMPYATVAGCVGWIIYRYTRAHKVREGREARLHIVKKGEC